MTAPSWLVDLRIPASCISAESSAQERGRRFSVRPHPGDQIWRIRVDGCWQIGSDQRKVDYLFWAQSASGRRAVLLVELKGRHFEDALEQIENTLTRLCKRAVGNIIHAGTHTATPGHDASAAGGVRAYVVLSKVTDLRLRDRERLRQRFGVIVYAKSQRLEAEGLEALLRSSA